MSTDKPASQPVDIEALNQRTITISPTRKELIDASHTLSEARLLMAKASAECVHVMNQIDALIDQISQEARS